MVTLLKSAYNTFHHVMYDLPDRRSDGWFLSGYVFSPVCVSLLYLVFVKKVGPWFMKDRPAYNLNKIISIYNLIQVGICAELCIKGIDLFVTKNTSFLCQTVDYSTTPMSVYILENVWKYYILKVVDLIDTAFFILRKKTDHVTFLHVYHHAAMVIITGLALKFYPGGQGIMGGTVNCLVHVVMYSYYFVTNAWPEYKKNVWWKKHITQLQMAQFIFLTFHILPGIFMDDCDYPLIMSIMILLQNIFLFFLFFNFYRKAYGKKSKSP
ncbi:very long chain fatty acid elongase AAEL008004-like [Periplaneta americana]|uniref:very long chain fatty acid elongase AAEL008004-like n=1 Tax=Periplaneta americana TaxID=6978 RepID=UPI0037E90486